MLVAAYLVLAAVEATRLLWTVGPPSPDVGFYAWETQVQGGGVRPFRWTTGHAALRRDAHGPVLELALFMSRPDIDRQPVTVALRLAGDDLDRLELNRNGWTRRSYYVAPIIGRPLERRPEPATTSARAGTTPAADPDRKWLELRPWHAPATPALDLEIDVMPTFVPAAMGSSRDRRELGVALAPIEWLDDIPPQGVGFHGREQADDGTVFRWTAQRWASERVRVAGDGARIMRIMLRADNPDIDESPLTVTLYWNERPLETVRLAGNDWQPVTLETGAAAGATGVLSLRVARTWRPADFGSQDERELGVAVSDVTWR